ncbi:MAG TPA: ferritin-like domain-containing protein [Polyangiaceae bacterium]|jgi:hypothetical protein
MSKTSRAPERVQEEWLRRVEAEYRSAAITQHLVLWLIQIGASPDLVHAGLRIVRDELAHASMSHRTFVAAGGEGAPRLARETLELPRTAGAPLEDDVTRVCLDVFCLGETVAVRLFKELRQRCEVPVARRVLDRVLRDEVRHRDFGWTLLGWLLSTDHGPRLRALVAAELAGSFARLRGQYAPAGAEEHGALPREETRWGLMPAARYGQLLAMTFERDYAPRFARLGLDPRGPWRQAVGLAGPAGDAPT